jgi:transcriptional regulator with XRE-family HTH domain
MKVNKKSGTPKMKKDMEAAKRIRSLRGSLTQARFAELLQVAQPMISAWEAGRELPASADLWLKFGEFAGWPECFWFWQRAGLASETLLAAAQKTLNAQIKDGTSGLEGKVIPIMPFQKDSAQVKEPLLLPGLLLSNPLSTSYFTIDEKSSGYGLEVGDILLIDASDAGSTRLAPFWDQMVLLEHDLAAEVSFQLKVAPSTPSDIEYLVGWLVLKEYRVPAQNGSVYVADVVPWLHVGIRPGQWYDAHVHTERLYKHRQSLKHMGGHADGSTWVGKWEGQPAGPVVAGENWDKDTEALLEQARQEVRLYPFCRILGRVIGWFRPPDLKRS